MDTHRLLKILGKKQEVKKVPTPKVKQYLNTPHVICPLCDFEHADMDVQQEGIATCGNCGQPFSIKITRTATGKKKQIPPQMLAHDEYIRTYTTLPTMQVQDVPIMDIQTVEEATKLYNAEKFTAEQFRDLVSKKGWDVTFWDMANEANPLCHDDDARDWGFTYNCHYHPQGKIFQWVVKPALLRFIDFAYGLAMVHVGKKKGSLLQRVALKLSLPIMTRAIDYAHNAMTQQYDKNAFKFTDPRINKLRELAHTHIDKYWQHDYPRKDIFARKCIDIVCALFKEDVFYRRLFLLMNDVIKAYPDGIPITERERWNVQKSQEEADRVNKEKGYAFGAEGKLISKPVGLSE